ncbi:MAG TPA: PilN domain-containing protein [Pyrinomonadaceae bacterium]
MIKVNLLDSVTDRTHSVAAVEARVANPRARSWILMSVVFGLVVLGMGVDYVSANYKNTSAKDELARQEEIAAKMQEINKQQADLEKKINEVKSRIEAIKKLRASQQGPVSLLSELNSRMPQLKDFSLTEVEQKNGELTIQGHSSSEDAVAQFARALEFSDKVFTNVSVETERKIVNPEDTDWTPADGEIDDEAPKPEVVKFKITCRYGEQPAEPAAAPDAKKKKDAPAA